MSAPRPELESAINEHSCALACFVSLARSCGVVKTQQDLIATYTPQIPKWQMKPGLLNVTELVGLLRVILNTRLHVIAEDKDAILELLKQPDTIGGFVITRKYWDENGDLADFNHCKRILGYSGDTLELMNPKQNGQADSVRWKWEDFSNWEAYALIVKK